MVPRSTSLPSDLTIHDIEPHVLFAGEIGKLENHTCLGMVVLGWGLGVNECFRLAFDSIDLVITCCAAGKTPGTYSTSRGQEVVISGSDLSIKAPSASAEVEGHYSHAGSMPHSASSGMFSLR